MQLIRWGLACVMLVGCTGSGVLPLDGPFGADASTATDGETVATSSSSSSSGGVIITTSTTGTVGTTSTGSETTASSATATTSTESTASTVTTSTSSSASTTSTSSTTSSSSTSSTSSAPTWTDLYTSYLAVGTIGDCDSSSCHHHTECSSASACYTWLHSKKLSGGGDLLSWDNGYMPPDGPTTDTAAEDAFTAWAAAGKLDN